MASCECCWATSRFTSEYHDGAYNLAMKEHEERGCACTKPTLEGARLRAGQWWQGGKDSRYTDEEWFEMMNKLETSKKHTPGTSPGAQQGKAR